MVIGDVVNAFSAANAILTFQPAAGVEVVITANVSTLAYRNNGNASQGVTTGNEQFKVPLTNTQFVRINAQGAGLFSGLGGIQTQ